MECTLILSILLLLISSTSSSSSVPAPPNPSTPCNKDDAKALLAIKSSLKAHATITWGQSKDCCDGSWYGVACNQPGRVTSIDIKGGTVFGQISSQVGDLPYLTFLNMYRLTNLTGPIPYSIIKLKQLTSLGLDWNSLSGPFPAFLSQLTKLDYLSLARNRFTGSIPASLGSLPLTFLRIEHNKLSGSIPESLGRIPATDLYLSHNRLLGPIPKSFANDKFEFVSLSHNKLTGDASFLFRPSSPLQRLDLSVNMLKFNLTKVKLPKYMDGLDLSNNKIYGSIPSEFMTRDWRFNVSYNMLCGKIPAAGLKMGRSLDQTVFFHNKCLCGPPLSPCK